MNRGSIRLRLWAAAAASLVIALALAGLGLIYLFELHVERRIQNELSVHLNQIVAATRFTETGLELQSELSDPRFAVPLSGYYWQVEDSVGHALLRSRSLWDEVLVLPDPLGADGALHVHELTGPKGVLLLAVERTITDPDGRSFRAMVAEDHATLTTSVDEYVGQLVPSLILLAAVLLAANFIQISVGLAPLARLRAAVREVIGGRARRLEGEVPDEVRPLSGEINRLLEAQERALGRARQRAADLAHGLKTPLQVLAVDVRTLREKGEKTLADDIESSVGAIRSHVERELARARVASDVVGVRQSKTAHAVAQVIDVVRRTPFGARLRFDVDVAQDLIAPADEGDLSEVLGNLIENAARFARSLVRIAATEAQGAFVLTVADDGPGIPAGRHEDALARGKRLDTDGQGTGLGLSIVSDIVMAYGGSLELADGGPGLTVTVKLPRPTS